MWGGLKSVLSIVPIQPMWGGLNTETQENKALLQKNMKIQAVRVASCLRFHKILKFSLFAKLM